MATVEQLITDNLDIWSSAFKAKSAAGRGTSKKIELYGIKKLRELIMELATEGLIVKPDENKRSEFLELENFADLIMGQAPPGSECNKNGDGTVFVKTGEFGTLYPEVKEWTTKPLKFAKEGDVLICVVGATVGKLNLGIDCAIGRSVAAIRPKKTIETKFLYYSLVPFTNKIRSQSKGSAQGVIGKVILNAVKLRLPSLDEQSRIVAKVDELMALCDQLEQQTETSISAHQTLVQTLLETLTNASEHDVFNEAWERIAEHFDTLFITEWSVDQLKQTILQLAVMGKLAPQDPRDEPASKLLKKIAAEKERLTQEKKIKKQKLLPPIGEVEKPFELPAGWEWVRLQDITSKITDGDHKTPPRITDGFKLLSAKNVRDGYLDSENCDFISEDSYVKSRERCMPEEGDLLIVSVGGTIGRSSVVPIDSNFALVRSVALIKPMYINSMFLKYAMDSNLLQDSIHSRKRGGAQPCLYLSEISMFPFSLPNIFEQNRIVAKVSELMAHCDTLKTRFSTAQITQLQLADAIGQQLFGHQLNVTKNTIKESETMKISTQLTLGSVNSDDTALIAPLLRAEDGIADAKAIWSKTKLELPAFYKQLKKEIAAGFITKPAQAEFEG